MAVALVDLVYPSRYARFAEDKSSGAFVLARVYASDSFGNER
jgi:hypothetical protein